MKPDRERKVTDTMNNELLCAGYTVTATEVPDEISLCFEISECPHRCKGCHSPHLQTSCGTPLLDIIDEALIMYDGMVTCVCFMGGDNNQKALCNISHWIKATYPEIKICVYSGNDTVPQWLVDTIDYIKLGEYDESLGGLNSETTNQRMYIAETMDDITYKFRRNNHPEFSVNNL